MFDSPGGDGNVRVGARRRDTDRYSGLQTTHAPGWAVVGGELDWANAAAHVSANGTRVTDSAFLTAGNTSDTSSIAARIGSTANGDHAFVGDIAEIIVLQEILSTEERQTIEGYLAHKWGLSANLPADHPYKSAAPILFDTYWTATSPLGAPAVIARSEPSVLALAHGPIGIPALYAVTDSAAMLKATGPLATPAITSQRVGTGILSLPSPLGSPHVLGTFLLSVRARHIAPSASPFAVRHVADATLEPRVHVARHLAGYQHLPMVRARHRAIASAMPVATARHRAIASAMPVAAARHRAIASAMPVAAARHRSLAGSATECRSRHTALAASAAAIHARHRTTSGDARWHAARHVAPAHFRREVHVHHQSFAASMGRVDARHQSMAGATVAHRTRHVAQTGVMINSSARHVAQTGAMIELGARHVAQTGAMINSSARHVAQTGAMTNSSARHVAPAITMPTNMARHTSRASLQDSHRTRHLARAQLMDANPFSARHCARAAMPDASIVTITGEIALYHNGHRLPLTADSPRITADEGSPVWLADLSLADLQDYARVRLGDPLTLVLWDQPVELVCDGRRLSAAGIDAPSYQISAISPIALLGDPWHAPLLLSAAAGWGDTDTGLARATCETLLGQAIDWRLPDWRLPEDARAIEATPLALARQIIEAAGGRLESAIDGSLIARQRYPVAVPHYARADAAILTDRDLLSHSDSAEAAALANRYIITSGSTDADTDLIQIESEVDPDDPHAYDVRAYPYPWRPVTLAHTGDSATTIGARIEIAPDHEELLEITNGRANTRYPVASVTASTYQYANLGAVTTAGTKVTTATAHYSLLRMRYHTRGYQWRVTNARTETIQFLAIE